MADFTFKANTTFLEEKYVTWSEVGLDSPDLTVIPASLWLFGRNTSGELGQNDITHRSSPVQVGTLTNWKQISVFSHVLAVKNDGTLWAWGGNNIGQLGLGTTTSISSPVQVGSLTNWKQVSVGGGGSSLAVKTDGTLWAWGSNDNGQLGLGDITNRSSPVQVGTASNWKQVSAGNAFTLAVKTDGTLWSWGRNAYGQLAQGTNGGAYGTSNRSSTPIQVGSLTNWRSVSAAAGANSAHVLAIKTDGTMWSWGKNNTGQLGLNDRTHRSSPVQIGALTTWSSISVGYLHSVAIKTDGTLWTWGWNLDGQLGLGTSGYSTEKSSPTQVGSLTDWKSVSAGPKHNVTVKTDGTAWVWGFNTYGQLGQGNKTHRPSPVQVGTLTTWWRVGDTRGAAGSSALLRST